MTNIITKIRNLHTKKFYNIGTWANGFKIPDSSIWHWKIKNFFYDSESSAK